MTTMLKSKLQADLNAAIKERNELRSSTLRLTLAAITKEEVAGKEKRELSDDEVLKVITREARSAARRPRPSRRVVAPSRPSGRRRRARCSPSTCPSRCPTRS